MLLITLHIHLIIHPDDDTFASFRLLGGHCLCPEKKTELN